MSKENRFRNSVYKVCLRWLKKNFEGKPAPSADNLAGLLRDNRRAFWKHEGVSKPTMREACLVAEIFKSLGISTELGPDVCPVCGKEIGEWFHRHHMDPTTVKVHPSRHRLLHIAISKPTG